MMSPTGKPEPELSLKQTSKTVYTLSYKVAEIGEHTLSIKFGEDDIPGSPFMLSTWIHVPFDVSKGAGIPHISARLIVQKWSNLQTFLYEARCLTTRSCDPQLATPRMY